MEIKNHITVNYKILKLLSTSIAIVLSFFAGASWSQDYQIGVGDEIRITVYDEPDLSFDSLRVDSLGSISFPFIGEVVVKDRTSSEIQAVLVDRLKPDYLVNPKVTVAVVKFRQFYVNGEVASPGGIAFQPGLNLHKAVTLAGGFTERASRSGLYVVAEGETGRGRKVGLDYKVQPGDVITIEQSFF